MENQTNTKSADESKPVSGVGNGSNIPNAIDGEIPPADVDDLELIEEEPSINWAKKLELPDISYNKIITKESIHRIDAIDTYVDETRMSIDQYRVDQEASLQDRYTQMVEKVKNDITKKHFEQLTAFKSNLSSYFDCIEEHCISIVKDSLEVLGKEIDDKEKLLGSVKSASRLIKDEAKVTLRINPDQVNDISELATVQGWSVEEDQKVTIGSCRFEVPLGQHISQFDASVSALLELIEL